MLQFNINNYFPLTNATALALHPVVASTDPLITPAHVTRARSGDDAASPAPLNVEATAALRWNRSA